MANQQATEVPKSTEKLASKYILDALKDTDEELEDLEEECDSDSSSDEKTAYRLSKNELPPLKKAKRIPEKKYFRIGETADIIGVESYVLRYWENEFHSIRPTKGKGGHRVYSRKDLEIFQMVRHLLYEENFSIKGAKKQLQERRKQLKKEQSAYQEFYGKKLKNIAQELRGLIQLTRQSPF